MALAHVRTTLSKAGGMKNWLSANVNNTRLSIDGCKQAFVCPIQVSTLKATHGQPMPRKAPFDYKNRRYNLFYQLTDKTSRRLDENSKVIVVDGSINCNKNVFAERLAKEFDMKFYKPICEDDLFVDYDSGLDVRSLNKYLPKEAQLYGLEDFYSEKNPTKGEICMFQIWTYRLRFLQYAEALTHLLNTGQGVVLVKSPFGDKVFADALRKMKYITSSGKKFYDLIYKNTICEMLPPHLTIFLDQPVSHIRKGISENGLPYEKNSNVLTDAYLQAIEDAFKKTHLPNMRQTGAVLEVDCSDMNFKDDHDWELITEDLEQVVLEIEDSESTQFQDWNLTEDMLGYYRQYYNTKSEMLSLFALPVTMDAPELTLQDENREAYDKIVLKHPLRKYDLKYHPELHSQLSIAMKW